MDVILLHTHKKAGVFSMLILLALLAVSMPAARADPGFTLEGIKAWHWVGDTEIRSVAVGNVDGDGQMEIVTGGGYWDGTRTVAQLTVWDGGTLQGVKTWYWISSTYISSVAVADVDGDGATEIVTGGAYHDGTYTPGARFRAQLCVWDGSSLALEGVKTWYWVDTTSISSVAVADVDGDGQMEIVTGGSYFNLMDGGGWYIAQLCVWDGSSLALEGVKTWYWNADTEIYSVAVADVDDDPALEIVTGGVYWMGGPHAQLCVWSGATLALEAVRDWYWTDGSWIGSVAVADVDDDPSVEVVTGGAYDDGTRNRAQLCAWTAFNLVHYVLDLERVKTWYLVGDTVINSVAVGDIDGDGAVEIVTGGHYWSGPGWWDETAQLCIWSGTLSLEGVKTWFWGGFTRVYSVACGDVDGDGSIEIVTGGYYGTWPGGYAQLCVWGFA